METKQHKTLEELCNDWLDAKHAEGKANARRLAIEGQIVALTGKLENGSQTHTVHGFKVTVTGKVSLKMDWDEWDRLKALIPEEFHPVRYKLEIDSNKLKNLKEHHPEYYANLPLAIFPAKTAVEVKAVVECAE